MYCNALALAGEGYYVMEQTLTLGMKLAGRKEQAKMINVSQNQINVGIRVFCACVCVCVCVCASML